MKSLYLVLSILLMSPLSLLSQDSLFMVRESVLGGMGAEYNDVWGYVHNGTEYAVIGSNNKINVINVNDCSSPTIAHQWTDGTSTTWRDFKSYGDYIYAVCDACSEGLQIIDKNTYTHYQYTTDFTKAHNIFVDTSSARLYVCGTNSVNKGLIVYDLSTSPSDPVKIGEIDFRVVTGDYTTNFYVHDLYVENDTVYASTGYSGLWIWDFTDINNVQYIGFLETTQDGYNHSSWKHPDADVVYIAEELPKGVPIYIFDVSDPVNIQEIDDFKNPLLAPAHTNVRPHNPFVHEDYLYISYYLDGIQIYDVSNPSVPTLAAYYDTYPSNTDYNADNGFNGAWGTYPFLPSGCILVSDITSGLNTFRLQIPPTKVVQSDKDIVLNTSGKGIIFTTVQDSLYKLSVNNTGSLQITNETGTTPAISVVENANLKTENIANGLVMKSPNQRFWRLTVSPQGTLSTQLLLAEPTEYTQLENEDVMLSTYHAALIQKDINGNCWKIKIDKNGALVTESASCLN